MAALGTTLNLGCGRKKIDGAVNVDVTPDTGPDLVHDLNRIPWPLPDGHFTEVIATDVIEHLADILAVMGEIHRIAAPGGVVKIVVPHFSSANAFLDPTHRHFFGYTSFDCFTGFPTNDYYTRVRFRYRSRQVVFHPTWVNKVVSRLARRRPERYEQRWCWIFPAWFLYVELEVVKPAG
jgi:SAM-dependent methyltransferase